MEMSIICPSCGKQAGAGSKFCPECGARLTPIDPRKVRSMKDLRHVAEGSGMEPSAVRDLMYCADDMRQDVKDGNLERFCSDAVELVNEADRDLRSAIAAMSYAIALSEKIDVGSV